MTITNRTFTNNEELEDILREINIEGNIYRLYGDSVDYIVEDTKGKMLIAFDVETKDGISRITQTF